MELDYEGVDWVELAKDRYFVHCAGPLERSRTYHRRQFCVSVYSVQYWPVAEAEFRIGAHIL
jgi:hypothetical protein